MGELYFIENGVKRKAKLQVCLICKKEFLCRKNGTRKVCSLICRNELHQNRVQVKCAACQKEFVKIESQLKSSRSGLFFCSRACKDNAQRIGGIKEIMPPHYNQGLSPAYYRRVYKETNDYADLKCERCGYCEFECGVDIHHIDENRENNNRENLMALCSPCHRALHFGLWSL